jgi:hypothetical protein
MKINLNNFEKKVYSQFNEDGITEKIFDLIGTTNKICVEFGVENVINCFFIEKNLLSNEIIENMNNIESIYRRHDGIGNYKTFDNSFKILNSEEALKLII